MKGTWKKTLFVLKDTHTLVVFGVVMERDLIRFEIHDRNMDSLIFV